MKRAVPALVLLVASLLLACGAKPSDHPEELQIHCMKFLREVELKDFTGAATRVHPKRRADFIRWVTEGAEKISYTNSRIQSLPSEDEFDAIPEDQPRKATIIVSVEYYRLPSTQVKTEVRSLEWLYDEEYSRWYLMDGWWD